MIDLGNIMPRHIAIIMDGNGRWAKKMGLPRIMGHREGAKAVREAIERCVELKIEALTLFAFSTENWKRPKKEIEALIGYLERFLSEKVGELNKYNIRLNTIGRIEAFGDNVQKNIANAVGATASNSGLVLTLALNYGARAEIAEAARSIALKAKKGDIKISDIDEQLFSKHLYTAGLPEVDLLIRTSGECRISNFLLWQISYSEIYITDTLWPDFKKKDLDKAIKSYQSRDRRFGAI